MITTIFFDLDGTLLPMDQDLFTKTYFGLLAQKMAPLGYEPEKLIGAIWQGIGAMVRNDGRRTNEEAFWDVFQTRWDRDVLADRPAFEAFYRDDFGGAQSSCGFQPDAAALVRDLKQAGKRVILATNPIFPAIATRQRIAWAGLSPEDFEWVTTYENTGYCKPNPRYYQDILQCRGLKAEECLMVGNDTEEDMAAETLGMEVYLLTDCLIDRSGQGPERWPHGGFPELRRFLRKKAVLSEHGRDKAGEDAV